MKLERRQSTRREQERINQALALLLKVGRVCQ
jgi:hypothetical protein